MRISEAKIIQLSNVKNYLSRQLSEVFGNKIVTYDIEYNSERELVTINYRIKLIDFPEADEIIISSTLYYSMLENDKDNTDDFILMDFGDILSMENQLMLMKDIAIKNRGE